MIHGAILVSGDGRVTQRLLDSVFFKEIEQLKIVGMVGSAPQSQALNRARNLHIPTFVVDKKLFPNAASHGTAVLNKLKDIDTDFVVADNAAAVPACVYKHYANRLVNVKLNAVDRTMEILVYLADGKGEVARVLGEATAVLEEGDTQESFTARVYSMAEELVLDAVESYCSE